MATPELIWKLVEELLETRQVNKDMASDPKKQPKDQFIANQKEIVKTTYYLFFWYINDTTEI